MGQAWNQSTLIGLVNELVQRVQRQERVALTEPVIRTRRINWGALPSWSHDSFDFDAMSARFAGLSVHPILASALAERIAEAADKAETSEDEFCTLFAMFGVPDVSVIKAHHDKPAFD